MEQLGADAAEREMEAELASEEQKKTLSAVVEELIELAYESRRRFDEMQETLVNHKREVRTLRGGGGVEAPGGHFHTPQ